jgi:CheY-like chemotaxis protein
MEEKNISGDRVSSMIKILVVEDNLLNQKIASYLLEGFGFSSEVAINGKQAIDLLQKEKFDLIMMDIQMPEMDGYETTGHIRNNLKLNIPIIATTGHSSGAEKSKCIESGMTDYISKPLRTEELRQVLNRYLFPDKEIPLKK